MLRQRAEQQLEPGNRPEDSLALGEARELVHELRVHQVEIELQNEELRTSQRELELARDRFKSLYDCSPVGYLTFGGNGYITASNQTAAQMLGTTPAALRQCRLYRLIVEADRGAFFAHRRALFETNKLQSCEVRLLRTDGSIFEARLESILAEEATGEPAYRTIISDIHARKEAEQGWRLGNAVIEATEQGLVVVDREWRVVRVNQALTKLTGFSPQALAGKPIGSVLYAEDATGARNELAGYLDGGDRWSGELRGCRRGGATFPARVSLSAIRNEQGVITHFAGLLVDITANKRAEARIHHQAYHDDVTGLPNRSFFVEQLGLAARAVHRHGTLFALLFVDLDHFKEVNDQFGHDVGDAVLSAAAERLRDCVRENDTVARIGGDEFAIVLLDVDGAQSAASVAEKILRVLATPLNAGGIDIACGASIGIALYPRDTNELDALRHYADKAMYRAKRAGRYGYRFYTRDMTAQALRHRRQEREIVSAMGAEQFLLHYQPVVKTSTGQWVGAEALLRWQHLERGLLRPAEFLDVCEDSGQIHALGDWVCRTACHDAEGWRHGGPFASVNVSERQLRHVESFESMIKRLHESGLPPKKFIVETTERALQDDGAVLWQLKRLQEEGVRLALDDFGTGESALASLKRFPVDILKIDHSLIQAMEGDNETARLVEAIIRIAHAFRIEVIAEGVETPGQLDLLHRECCDYVQGNLLSPPLPENRFRALLSSSHA